MTFQPKLLGSMKIHLMFHVSLLEPYHAFTNPIKDHDPLPPIKVDYEHEHEMEDILDSKISIVNSNILFISMGMM